MNSINSKNNYHKKEVNELAMKKNKTSGVDSNIFFKKRLNNKLKEKNIDIDIDKVTNSNEVALYLIERIEKDNL